MTPEDENIETIKTAVRVVRTVRDRLIGYMIANPDAGWKDTIDEINYFLMDAKPIRPPRPPSPPSLT